MSICVTIDGLFDDSTQERVWYRADGFPDGSAFYRGRGGVLFFHHFQAPGSVKTKVNYVVSTGCSEDTRDYVRDTLGLDPETLQFSPVAKRELLFERIRDEVVV